MRCLMMRTKRKILLDSDVIIHFCKGDSILVLPKIFSEEKVILDVVLDELKKRRDLRQYYDNLISFKLFNEISFDNEPDVIREYARLTKKFGSGESACLAYCRFHDDIIGSSNTKDIIRYCKDHLIVYYTTMDFLSEALKSNIMSKAECDLFINKVKTKGSKLPCDSIDDYINYPVNR